MPAITTIADVQPVLLDAMFFDRYFLSQVWKNSGILRNRPLLPGGTVAEFPDFTKLTVTVRDYEPNADMEDPETATVDKFTLRISQRKYTHVAVDVVDEGESLPNLLASQTAAAARSMAYAEDDYIRDTARISCIQVASSAGTETSNTAGDHNAAFTWKASPDKASREGLMETIIDTRDKMADRPLPDGSGDIMMASHPYFLRQVRRWALFDAQRFGSGRLNDEAYSDVQVASEVLGIPVVSDRRMPTTGGVGTAYPIYFFVTGRSMEWVERVYGGQDATPANRRALWRSYLTTYGAGVFDANRIERIYPSVVPT